MFRYCLLFFLVIPTTIVDAQGFPYPRFPYPGTAAYSRRNTRYYQPRTTQRIEINYNQATQKQPKTFTQSRYFQKPKKSTKSQIVRFQDGWTITIQPRSN